MNLKKAVVSGVILYALMFLLATILMFGLQLSGLSFNIPMLVVSSLIMFAIIKYYYFSDVKVSNPLMDGLKPGILIALVVFLIEIPVMIYVLAVPEGWAFFAQWNVILGYLLSPIIGILVAYTKR